MCMNVTDSIKSFNYMDLQYLGYVSSEKYHFIIQTKLKIETNGIKNTELQCYTAIMLIAF